MGALLPLRMDSEDARTCIENRFTVFAGIYRFNPDEPEHDVNPARSVFVQLKHAQTMSDAPTQSCWPCGRDSGAHSALSRFRVSGSESLSSRGSRITRLFGLLFHVKHSSDISAAARPVSPPRCHSDAPTQSCAPTQLCCQRRISQLQGQPILHVRRFFVAGSSE